MDRPHERDTTARDERRCPYCHDAVGGQPAVVCEVCEATHHEECRAAHGACASCGFGAQATAPRPRRQVPRAIPRLSVIMLVGLIAGPLLAMTAPLGLGLAVLGALIVAALAAARGWETRGVGRTPGSGVVERLVVGKEVLRARHVETVVVPAYLHVRVRSGPLTAGAEYVLEVSGTTTRWAHVDDGVDAVYCYAEWRVSKDCPAAWCDLRIDGRSLGDVGGAELPYAPDHVYRVRLEGRGEALQLWSEDAQGSSHDNGGEYRVRLLQVMTCVMSAPPGD